MIRTIACFVFAVLYLIFSIPVLFFEWLLAKINKPASDLRCLRLVQWAFRVICGLCGVRTVIIGEENIPKDTAVLYAANHRSWFDIMLTYSRTPGLTGFVAKDNIERIPLLSNWMKRLYCLFMNRDDMRAALKCVRQGVDQLKNGISIFIFPEGTRHTEAQPLVLPFKEGSLKMAEKAGAPIIPVALTNTREIFENHLPYARPCKVIIEYGDPIIINELSKEDKKHLGAYTQHIIEEMLSKNASMISEDT